MIIERLDGHDRSTFDCGVPELNDWLRTQAAQQQKRGNSATFVGADSEDGRVVGYYSSLAYRLDLDEVATAYGAGKRRYPMPAVLLARLAVCVSYRGKRAGEALLVHALSGAVDVADNVGVEVLVVHAIDKDAAAFYGRYGFTQFADHELHLFMPMKAIRSLVR
ncbi:GNAT family N-acetyltransferase [Microcella daejeonensis]|uniref:GNAT family N-acetyltransferase n=1 Tax=Microcella daejeonensis TaxID=2994971 RepID=A0A9E8MMR8_9MICO|nr:GNAT family N-acetyltransferase [Microcella daejeonensis]WAB82530.1 GNAT family N-acetyltransferase [Microcella daejeonensis]